MTGYPLSKPFLYVHLSSGGLGSFTCDGDIHYLAVYVIWDGEVHCFVD